MSLLVVAGLSAGIGVGLAVLVAGLTGRRLLPEPRWHGQPPADPATLRRFAIAVAAAAVVLVVTGWVAAALLAAMAVWVLPRLFGGRSSRDAAIARTEAIAGWTEMVRDSIVAAAGLEEAIAATGPVAPGPIAPEVQALVRRLDPHSGVRLADALETFGADVRHPSADLVVASLVIGTRMEVSDLSGLLSRLADAIRDDARMRIRVEVGRARVRTAAKLIVGVVVATVGLLVLLNLDYLRPYHGARGQVVLLLAGGMFALGGWLLDRMATVEMPERFTARSEVRSEPWS